MKGKFLSFALSLMLLTLSVSSQAQQPTKTWKIGVLVSSTEALNKSRDEALRQGLRDFGYEEGKNIVIDYKYAEGKPERLAQLAKELVAEKPDVIVVGGTAVAVAVKNATNTTFRTLSVATKVPVACITSWFRVRTMPAANIQTIAMAA